ncbi:MAG TPA: class I SAM-dependent methyltransferase [Gemmatimonadaceae bacterium]|nr:class I SAM-dependent methyltransferase [Gemmatimonadaceae bacterium]
MWGVELLAIDPADHLLEIGCGAGAAVSLICERLVNGHVTAIDRSATAVRSACRRNRAHVEAGRATILRLSLEEADFGGQRFRKILAVNVNAFWTRPTPSLARLKALLAPGGAAYLVYQAPSASQARRLVDELTRAIPDGGLAVARVLHEERFPGPLVGVVVARTRSLDDRGGAG